MSRIWAVARQMIAEGVRMKLAMVFVGFISLVVLGLPFSISGDSSLTGAVQSFMQYGLTATGFLLSLMTIFMSRSLADELVGRQIFLVMTKPIPRWQYLAGKWVGITVLNALFLFGSGATIYAMVHYIKRTHPPIDTVFDQASLENEILVARHALLHKPPDFAKPARYEYERNLEEGLYENSPEITERDEIARLTGKHEARWRVVGPREKRVFEFENVLCDRSAGREIQIRYKTEVSKFPPDEVFRGVWMAGDAAKGTPVYRVPVRHVVGRFHSVRFPADAVAADNTLTVFFANENPFEGEPQYNNVMEFRKSNDVEVLFVVGSFEWNLFRLLVLMLCKLMFLGAVAILLTTVFSFPVASLASFTVYVLAGTRSFILESFDLASSDQADMFSSAYEFIVQLAFHLYNTAHWVIPDFGRYDAIESFVNGRNVGLVWVLQGVFWLVLLKTSIVLGSAMLLFHRREVAEVSV